MKTLSVCFLFSFFLFACGGKTETKTPDQPVKPFDSLAVIKAPVADNPYVTMDISPMDMSYFPVNYMKTKMASLTMDPPLARVIYSRPHLQGRHIFHEVLKYGQPWRLGANEATELQLFSDATIQGKKVKAGRYILYCIPQENEWTLVLNGYIDSWGLKQEPSKDIARFTIPITKTNTSLEYFTMVFLGKDKQAELLMAWDNVEAKLPISF
ncbi:MAG: hypothetical protein BWZ05_00334 [Bacteroidetes bacterium ADurb.BinA245]|jgi:hypothetical protein|nr:MAG: hypothetical protein BWZ05_00334 [Bacteroidetes bacterium ADurb.BinA245]HNA18394.1 DUF2911 domain-containing protein [Chitinophagaceae bacterium]HRF22700.1 DUF2911 domain-containing protein [Chitinophagaceae bacterium]